MERIAYLIKHRFPSVFRFIETLARMVTALRYGRSAQRALSQARIEGQVRGAPAVIRPLNLSDAVTLHEFLNRLPEEHVEHFHPHGFEQQVLGSIIQSRAYMTYGLFVDEELVGYALLKLAPTGSAYIGRLLHPQYAGMGLGSLLATYLYWQASTAGLRPRSTISKQNEASLGSHRAAGSFRVVSELPNDYLLIEFPSEQRDAPALDIQ
ncbi:MULTISPECIES: GNAT family N-acetyltransferase [Halorhodospira]|uniref:GNAT family N-acetyltransferase n=1 Tax=Halorhodospira TaxID=85108 RepID=UPI001EE9123E|nr:MULTISPECIES: GNAT family N-acetyltransferase [Halorhodospira]MCG5529229.1 GNAT family N-acetyltransferase [Halorhodospira halophila]MCG5544585.1 GNAT family N-acetyltransferase [Halorhodospira sp. 9628]